MARPRSAPARPGAGACYDPRRPGPPGRPGGTTLLQLYDSRARALRVFEPIDPPRVRLYVCGVTPYDVGHLGHALTYVVFDTLRRYLEFQSYEVAHIQNITDVDDDMVRKSAELGVSIDALTRENHARYLSEMDALHVLRPQDFPRVSAVIPEIIAAVEQLLASGHAYAAAGHVFFDTQATPGYGELSGLTREALRSAPPGDSTPAEPAHLKRDPLDFLLWQPSTAAGATFPSPWGAGRPGWHIECSVMAQAALGPQIDIHGGGRDLRYPHHEAERAQAEALSDAAPFCGWWMHVGTMQLDGVKMSKSLGNLVRVSELLDAGHDADAVRLSLLARHYREDRDHDPAALDRAAADIALFRRALQAPGGPPDRLAVQSRRLAFMEAMDDDLDTPAALEILRGLARDLLGGALYAPTAAAALAELLGVLGLLPDAAAHPPVLSEGGR